MFTVIPQNDGVMEFWNDGEPNEVRRPTQTCGSESYERQVVLSVLPVEMSGFSSILNIEDSREAALSEFF